MFSFFRRSLKPYQTGFVSVGQGHSLFYQQFGNPKGTVVLSFHGGPGGCGRAKHVLDYDLKTTRVIIFDQRGCGQSRYTDAFRDNTTQATIRDAVKLLDALHIKKKIVVAGGSFGSGLALLFAEMYPQRVSKLILHSVFLMREQDALWVTHNSRLFYPDLIDEMRRQAKSDNIVPYYHTLIFSDKYKDIQQAQKYFGSYEHQLGQTLVGFDKTPALTDSYIQSGRIYLHYEQNHFFVKDNQILDQIDHIQSIPTLIVHNRLDFCCPIAGAYDLAQVLKKARLVIVPEQGHGGPLLRKTLAKEIRDFL